KKKGKSAGVDNIPAELIQTGGEDVISALTTICNKIWQTGEWQTPWMQSSGEDVISALTTICNKIWQTGEWQTPWTQSLVITLPKKGNLQQCQNYRTISLISHPRKVMLKTT
ncbi:hypothetical protein, partial [Thiolapillus sp.]|uniref:hypothetical protein n=1 Tax=Thiolapillus sp. TaxID=2017437 RepID=UPI003AF76B46